MSSKIPKAPHKPRRLDGKSLRYLGLLVGLCGIVYLSLKSPDNANPLALVPERAGQQPLTSAAFAKPPEVWLDALWQADVMAVSMLLKEGLEANGVLDRRGTRPLHLLFFGPACEFGESSDDVLPVLELLLQGGAEVQVSDQRGNTPLMFAVAECSAEVVTRLLQAGADSAARNALGLSAFELTLTNANATGKVLADAGYRLSEDQFAHYQALYHDEPEVLHQLSLARPTRP